MRIAIVGTGISGLVAAHRLRPEHQLTVFEADSHVGGHTLTTDVEWDGRRYAVDAGFIVFNEVNYPHLVRLFDELRVDSQETSMSFSVRCERTGLEYAGTSLAALFAQRRNALRPSFWRLLADVVRFNRDGRRLLADGRMEATLGETLARGGYSESFTERYLVPMGAAIWSMPPERMLDFPAAVFLRFLDNHGLLGIRGHHTWRSVVGGSRRYVEKLVAPFADRIRTDTPVRRIRRGARGVRIETVAGERADFDRVVIATHSDQALRLLADPTDAELEVLGAIPYQRNTALLHTDTSVLPRRRRAWASWNYHVPRRPADRVRVTYNLKMLQRLESRAPTFCVSLNMDDRIDPRRVLRRFEFTHPVFGPGSVEAQRRRAEVSGVGRTHFCGAYWGHGFHEDGVVSGLAVAREIEAGRLLRMPEREPSAGDPAATLQATGG